MRADAEQRRLQAWQLGELFYILGMSRRGARAVRVAKPIEVGVLERSDEESRSDRPGAEPRRFLGGAHEQRRACATGGAVAQLVGKLEREHRSEGTVVATAVGNRVYVRARGHERPGPAWRQCP
jgi:hypothetical protein